MDQYLKTMHFNVVFSSQGLEIFVENVVTDILSYGNDGLHFLLGMPFVDLCGSVRFIYGNSRHPICLVDFMDLGIFP